MEEEKRGGPRPGAGRRPKEAASSRTFWLSDKMWNTVKKMAKKERKSISRWLTELIEAEIARRR